ncbi:microtubule organization protein AKNA isoform X1 [Labrus mixtus]|uniref:microtubule organization protein AKNA isoform X1 n=1 Tax=Labrus mixtus TaxID=508554 RepID=UPI0029BFB4AA|nr:microtubule organization protein AKNA isoform X1 [Labrus mixtus]
METRKNTTAGVLFWTPAPVRTSSPSSVISEDEWEDEEKEQAQKDDDFFSQMDENGIIGLSEALEDVELVETCGDVDAECSANSGPLTPEEEDFSEYERELRSNLRALSQIDPPAEDVMLSLWDDFMGNFKSCSVNEKITQRKDFLPENDKYLDMTEEEQDCETAGKKSDIKRTKSRAENSFTESHTSKREIVKTSSAQSSSDHLLAMKTFGVSNHHCHPASSVNPQIFPHLLHFTAEEITAAPGIEAETLPEMSSIESIQESPRSHTSLKSSPRPEVTLRASPQPVAMFSEDIVSNCQSKETNRSLNGMVKTGKHHKQPTPSPRKTKKHPASHSRSHCLSTGRADSSRQTTSCDRELRAPRSRSDAAKVDESKREPLSYRTPDFSKVEPRVHFPKGGYTPPKSGRSVKRESLSPEPPVVFKSPAEIVKEVLLNTPDGSPEPSGSCRAQSCAPLSIVPQEFRSQQQAIVLSEQLQEDYNILLTKHAEAKNTIDRLRLGAKVNLYSDPPKPGHLVQSGLNREPSKVMTLDFPQVQRAEMNSASLHPNGPSPQRRSPSACPSTSSPGPQLGQQLANILYSQAEKFIQQLQTFEDLLKTKQLKSVKQMEGVSQLAEGLDSLERGYLMARDEHKVLLQQGAEIGHFDSERELEGLIFQCGLSMEEVKEQVEQITCEAPPTPQPDLVPSVPLTQPKSQHVPSLVDQREVVVLEESSASEESKEETLTSIYLKPLDSKHRCVEQDFVKPVDHYQSFKEFPKRIDHGQKDGASLSATGRTNMQPVDQEKGTQNHGAGNVEGHKSLPRRQSTHRDSPPICSRKQLTSRPSPPSGRVSSQSISPPSPSSSSRRSVEMGKSHSSSLSSLGEMTALERRTTKLPTGISRVLSQDRIVSPEMDSGFVGSESSRLTPAAAPSPLHQRAAESVLVHREGNQGKPQTGPASAPSPACSQLHSQTAVEHRRGSQFSNDQPKRSRQGRRRRMFSCSPQRRRADSETSEFGLQSDSTASEDKHYDRYTEYINSLHSSSSSPAARYHHRDSLRAPSSSQVENRNAAIQALQEEVSRLKEKLDSCSKNQRPQSSLRAAPLTQENYTHTSTRPSRSGERWSEASRGRRDRHAADEVEESTIRRTTRKRVTSAHRQKTQPDDCAELSTPEPPPLVSRSTQTSAAARDSHCLHTNKVHSTTQTRQHPGVSETADEPDSRSHKAPLCPQCLSHRRGQPAHKPAVSNREAPPSSHCHHCHLCGGPDVNRSADPDCHRVSDSSKHTTCHPAQSHPAGLSSKYFTAAASPLHCMPVCPPPLLVFSLPLYVSPSNSIGTSSGVRGRGEVRTRTRRSLSADRQLCADGSLNRAIRAARHMKHTSGHMARSLASGLHYHQLLSASCSY